MLKGMGIADTAIRQPVFITMLMLLAVTFGILSYTSIPVNLLPEINIPIVAVTISYPGAGPNSVVEQVAKPVEQVMNTISGIKHITSTSSDGQVIFVLEFNESVDISQAETDVREKINTIRNSLPRDIREPIFARFDPNQAAIVSIAISPIENIDPLTLKHTD